MANALNDHRYNVRVIRSKCNPWLTLKVNFVVVLPIQWLESSVKLFGVGFHYFLRGFWEIFHESP